MPPPHLALDSHIDQLFFAVELPLRLVRLEASPPSLRESCAGILQTPCGFVPLLPRVAQAEVQPVAPAIVLQSHLPHRDQASLVLPAPVVAIARVLQEKAMPYGGRFPPSCDLTPNPDVPFAHHWQPLLPLLLLHHRNDLHCHKNQQG